MNLEMPMAPAVSIMQMLGGVGPLKDEMPVVVAFVVASLVGLLLLQRGLTPRVDAAEPPLLKPRIPLIGHIIGLFRHQAKYHLICCKASNAPIATLPMFTGKMYAIWDPTLITAALKSKNLSRTPQSQEASGNILGLSKEGDQIVRSERGGLLLERMDGMIGSSLRGDNLVQMTQAALEGIGSRLSGFATESPVEIPNVWMWLRRLAAETTTGAVYGKEDPFAKNPGSEQALWDFAANMLQLATGVFPSVIAPAGARGRTDLTNALHPYYSGRHDEDPSASAFARACAVELRAIGMPEHDITRIAMLTPFAALVNTVPTLFWFFTYVFSQPELVIRLRAEVSSGLVAKHEDDEFTLITGARIEELCPLLWACHRETLRLAVHQVSSRVVMQDTTLADGNGKGYLLKKGTVAQIGLGVPHFLEEFWGEDVLEFNPMRFLEVTSKPADAPGGVKAVRTAFQPFGGGNHLCPGRYFANAEMFAILSTLLLFFDVQPLGGKTWKIPERGYSSMVDAVTKPAGEGDGFGVKITRREGFEGVRWRYEL